MISLHEYNARNNSGIWLEPGLLDLDMATRRCRIAPLHHIGDGLFRLHLFQEDWILVEGNSDNGNRSDYARLWNRRTDEVLRIRPGVFGSESFKKIHALPDGTIVVNTHQHTDDILSLPEDFWHFLRTASRPNKLGYWLNYPKALSGHRPFITSYFRRYNSDVCTSVRKAAGYPTTVVGKGE